MFETALNRGGIAALADLDDPVCRRLLDELLSDQESFLAKEAEFRSPEYRWPRDAIRTWSRVWEYPYAYWHLDRWRSLQNGGAPRRVLDLGSGVTFFPFSVARLGLDVVCADIDPICCRDLERAARAVDCRPGAVRPVRIQGDGLPLADGEFDAVYCLSVLEHIPQFERTVSEVARVLKPGGWFVLTVDLDLRGDREIGPERHADLKRALAEAFEPIAPERTIHPRGALTTEVGPFRLERPEGWRRWVAEIRRRAAGVVRGRPPRPLSAFHLAVEGSVLRRR
jgi:SAM-dependent methyltransferase